MPSVDFRPLFEDNPNPIVLFDRLTRRLLAVNDAACQHFGYTREELLGRDLSSLRPDDEAEHMRDVYESERVRASPQGPMPFPGVWRHQRKDGTVVPVEIWRMRIEYDGHAAVMALIHDVSDRLRAEESLRASEERFRALIERSDDATTLVDAEGLIVYASPSTRRASGYEPAELVGKSVLAVLHPDDAPLFAQVLERLLADPGSSVPALYRARHADGSWRWIDGIATNLLHVPSVRAIVANYRDVTARVTTENALRESEERYRLLFDATPVPVFVLDLQSLRYLAVNDATLEKYGYSREELLAMNVLDIRPPEDVARLKETLASLDGTNFNTGSWRHHKKDGTTFEVEITTHAVEFAGRPARLVVARDVTEGRRLEEQLRLSQKMEATGLLAGGVAHDFNNLLGVILGSGELAKRAAATGRPVDAYLAEIDAAARRAAELTRKLLAFSRKQVLNVQTLDLGETVEDFLQLLRRVIGEDIELVARRSPRPLVVSADASQLEQVLLNLCTNARQAMLRAGGSIVLETRRTRFDADDVQREPWAEVGDWAEIRVVDTGEGMDAETRGRVFEPFFTTKRDGTGLGLAMVHGIIHQHRGFVHLQSRPGAGTSVHVYLPIVSEATDVARERTPANGVLIRGGRETLLVAEDEPPLRGLLALTLSELGYEVITASDGEEAARAFAERPGRISLAILDVVMPHLGGVQAFERMRALDPTLKVIFITGYAPEHAQVSDILENSGRALLHKPFALKDLGHKVRETLDERA